MAQVNILLHLHAANIEYIFAHMREPFDPPVVVFFLRSPFTVCCRWIALLDYSLTPLGSIGLSSIDLIGFMGLYAKFLDEVNVGE